MTSLPDRQQFVAWFNETVAAGAGKVAACTEMNLSLRTIQRWTQEGTVRADARPTALRPTPANALSPEERAAIVVLCNRPEYATSQIVPRLADKGQYVASESTFYRVLRAAHQQHRRGRSQPPQRRVAPATHVAMAANQVWSWDITYLPSPGRGKYYYLYLIEDIYSRKAVGCEVYEQECGASAVALDSVHGRGVNAEQIARAIEKRYGAAGARSDLKAASFRRFRPQTSQRTGPNRPQAQVLSSNRPCLMVRMPCWARAISSKASRRMTRSVRDSIFSCCIFIAPAIRSTLSFILMTVVMASHILSATPTYAAFFRACASRAAMR